jgi:DUF4097 and DUF4098 domain-containing protein YvlB
MSRRQIRNAVALPIALLLFASGCAGGFILSMGQGADGQTYVITSELKETESIPPQRFDVGAAPEVVVKTPIGRIDVSAQDGNELEVSALKHAANKEDLEEIKLDIEKTNNIVTIQWRNPASTIKNRTLDITVKAPQGALLRLLTGNGPITIGGFARGAEAKTGVGPIQVKAVAGDLTLVTGNGPITVEGAAGAVNANTGVGAVSIHGSKGSRRVHTGNGPIQIDGAFGDVSARADLGRIVVQNAKGNLDLHTGNGAIQADAVEGVVAAESGLGSVDVTGSLSGNSQIKTGNGKIRVAVPTESRLTVEASTGNGAIETDFALPVTGTISRKALGSLGDGSAGSLRLSSGIGRIEIRKR